MTFRKGESGNPGGRTPKTAAERKAQMLLEDFSPEAVELLIALCRDQTVDHRSRLSAIKVALDKTRVGADEFFPAELDDWSEADWRRARALCDAHLSK